MLRTWQHLDRFDEGRGCLRAWLFRVAHNIAIDKLQANRQRPVELDDDVVITPDHAEDVDRTVVVRAAVAQLSPCHREVLFECYNRRRTTAEAAAYLRIPAGTVSPALRDAAPAQGPAGAGGLGTGAADGVTAAGRPRRLPRVTAVSNS